MSSSPSFLVSRGDVFGSLLDLDSGRQLSAASTTVPLSSFFVLEMLSVPYRLVSCSGGIGRVSVDWGFSCRWYFVWYLSARSTPCRLDDVTVGGCLSACRSQRVLSRRYPRPAAPNACPFQARRSGTALLVASMALLVLQPSALSGVVEGDYGDGGRSWRSWREYVEQACGVAVAGVGVLTLTGLASPTK